MAKGDLTPRQRIFVREYAGNATQAAMKAGCSPKSAPVTGSKWLKLPKVRKAIQQRDAGRSRATIATREEKLETLTQVMRKTKLGATPQLKAIAELNKMQGDNIQKLEVRGELGLLDLVRESMEPSKEASNAPPVKAGVPAEVGAPPAAVAGPAAEELE